MQIETEDYIVEFEDTPELRQKVFQEVLDWYHEMVAFSGEQIMQTDNPQIEAAPFLAKLADEVFRFKRRYKGEEE